MTPTEIDESDYTEADESMEGWCTECAAFTTGCCEPDARRYKCDECGQRTVYGAQEALLMGMFAFSGED